MELEGFVIYSRQIGEKLRQIAIYSDRIGKVGLIVKLKRGDFPLAVDLFSLSRFKVLQKGEDFELQEFKLIRPSFPESQEEFFYLSRIAKLLLPFHLPANRKLFTLIDRYFQVKESFQLAYTMFLLKFSFLEGIFPTLNRCVSCGSKSFQAFSLEKGGVVCNNCITKDSVPWSRYLSKLATQLTKESFEKEKSKDLPLEALDRIAKVFESHVNYRLS
ncbi:DNA repair protein RecO [Phorcysia thermohydrogeniphila]|uniref:DNA replication and repair protein RecO n=1 Tax=Phorcysia thermohydrogeniphila TaxID=936138 RepID=A0A4R1GH05_9BACT|nr:DNA repair protein RecO [Phorcysia thermohydrogeniphila]TCK06271.1 DNA replication and repair protein RecO [Phorcysia thermohydrogeniphila]